MTFHISEKETLHNHLKWKFFSGALEVWFLLSISGIGFYQYNLKKTYKSRFETIINKQKPNSVPADSNQLKHTNKNKESIGIAEELVVQILKLNHFESTNEYLQSTISLQLLAEKLETNSKYVSKIVNIYKENIYKVHQWLAYWLCCSPDTGR
jgi:hypothetical protein